MKTRNEITKKQTNYNNANKKLTGRRKMKYFSIIFAIMVAALIGRSSEDLTGWEFDQSTQQSFYLLEVVTIDGLVVEGDGTGSTDGNFGSCDLPGEGHSQEFIDEANISPGNCVNSGGTWEDGAQTGACSYFSDDNNNAEVDAGEWHSTGECDVVGSFRRGVCEDPQYQNSQQLCEIFSVWNTDEEICIGWRYADSNGSTTVPLMGKEGSIDDDVDSDTYGEYPNTFYYANGGESAYLKIYDASNGSILELNPSAELPGWELNAIFTIEGTSTAANTMGCTDVDACNFNSDATADDGSCLSNDCAGVCGGSAEEDACGVCGGDGSDDVGCGCFQPGPSGCDNVCGSTAVLDECGVCDGSDYNCDDAANDCSCAGCTNVDADNTDSSASIDDGTCEFTVPGADGLVVTVLPGKLKLDWDAPADNFASSAGYIYHIYQDGEYSRIANSNTATINGLEEIEYCFTVLAIHNTYGASDDMSNEACGTPDPATGGPCWRIQLTADLLGYGQFPVTDDQNWLGTAEDATWGYDETHDIPEPPHDPEHWVSLYFPHPEWSSNPYDEINFTEDIVNANPYFHQHNLTRWDFEVVSSIPGPASVKFDWENPDDGCVMQPDYKFYVLTDLVDDNIDDPHYYEISDGDSLEFYLGSGEGLEQTKQNFSMFIGNIVPQAPADLSVTGGDRDMQLNWSDDGCADDDYDGLDDERCRYPATSYNVYRDGLPTVDNWVEGNPGSIHFSRDHYAGGSGLGEASLLSVSSSYDSGDTDGSVGVGQANSDFYDDNSVNKTPAAECAENDGLLYESYYFYTVTSSNAAGESSEGHVIRPSGSDKNNTHDVTASSSLNIPNMDSDEWYNGRLSQESDWTDRNTDPTSISAHDGATDDTDNNYTIYVDDGDTEAGEGGIYRIPHNSDDDNNTITVCVEGHGSNDDNETDGDPGSGNDETCTEDCEDPWVRLWSLTDQTGQTSGIIGDLTESQICFSDYNTFAAQGDAEVDQTYTFNQNITDTYPVKSQTLDEDGNWVNLTIADMEAYADTFFTNYPSAAEIVAGNCGENHHQSDSQIEVTIKPEPNRAPIASNPLDLIEPGDGLSDHDMNYDEVDALTGGLDCMWHQLEGEWACDYGDTDNDFDSDSLTWVVPHDGDPSTDLAHLWFRAEDSYDPDNRDYGGDWDGANDGFHGDSDELSYQWFEADGEDDFADVWNDHDGDGQIDDGELVTGDVDLGTDSYGLGNSVQAETDAGYNNINLDLRRAVQDDSPSARLITMVVTDEYGYSASSTLVVQVTAETNDAPTVGQLDSYTADTLGITQYWIVEYMDDDKETEVRSHHAKDADDDDLDYKWTYDSGSGGVYNRGADDETALVEGSMLESRYNFLDYNTPDAENCAENCGDGLGTENSDIDLWRDLVLDLNVGNHTFTFHAEDNYGAKDSTTINIKVDNEPPAATPEIEIVHQDLRYVTIDVRESEYSPSTDGNTVFGGPPAGYGTTDELGEQTDDYTNIEYTGSTWNTAQLDLYRDGVHLHTWSDVNEAEGEGIDSGERRYVDSPAGGGLAPSTTYTYTVEARNSDRNSDADSENSDDATTGNRPTVNVITPNGGDENGSFEMWSIGDIFDVDFTTTDQQYISRIEVEYSRDGGATWSPGTDNHDCCNSESNETGEGCYDNPFAPQYDRLGRGWNSGNPGCYNAGDELYDADGWVETQNAPDGDPDDFDTNDEHDLPSSDWTDSIAESNGCAGENGFDDDPDTGNGTDCCVGCVNGDGVDNAPSNETVNFGISDNAQSTDQDDDITNQAMVKVRVYDKGDYYGQGVDSNEDSSDNVFTMADHRLHRTFSEGWHLFGPALEQYDNTISDSPNDANPGGSDGNDDGTWWSDYGQDESLGDWGSNWIIYTADGEYDNISSNQGIGYYLALAQEETMVVTGTPAIIDDNASGTSAEPRTADDGITEGADTSLDGEGDWVLQEGWNLVSNPLVVMVSKYNFEVCDGADCASYHEAVDNGWIAPSIYGWFQNSYEPYVRLMPFSGYWVNTSRQLDVKIRPYYLDSDGNDLGRESVIATNIELNARDISGEGSSDFITVGLSENADNKFVYGEDEYDLPKKAYTSLGGEYIDLKVGSGLMKDIKSSEYGDYQAWTVSITKAKVDNDIELSWGDVSGFAEDLHIIVDGEAINMHEERIAVLNSMIEEVAIVVGNVDSYLNPIPEEFGLNAAYPNPFNPTTTLGLALNVDGHVSMSVFNIRGQVVEVLVDRNMKAGYHNVTWNADGISSGMYFVQVETGANTAMQKLMLLK